MVRKLALLNPRFGMRRNRGFWPPSNPSRTEPPERAVWPLPPRPLVLPCPELSPIPNRLVRCLAPGRGFKLCSRIVMLAYLLGGRSHQTTNTVDLIARAQLEQRIYGCLHHVHRVTRPQ